MAKEPEISLPAEEPRRCPSCGSRVAAMATTCLMCGSSLVEEEATPEESEKGRQRLPGWARALIVVMLALAILSAGSFGLYTLLNAEPENVTPTATPTRTPTATPTSTPTQTPTSTPTPTPIPPLVHQVQQGETLIAIAVEYGTAVEAILALNPEVDPELIQVGQLLLIPAPTPVPGPTSTPEPGVPTPTPPDYVVHVVVPGDTLSSIAEQYGISVALIRTANDLPVDDDTIRPNQSLVIPMGTPVPSPTPTVDPNATPTPVPPYRAPALLSPPDGATLAGSDEPVLLQWASVSILRDDEWYELTLSQTPPAYSPAPSGVVSATYYARATAWRVPIDLLMASDADAPEFHWQVQVVREARDRDGELVYEEAGAPSEVRTFTWLMPTPSPTYTPTPSPSPTSTP
jgi:LysM repeat protein